MTIPIEVKLKHIALYLFIFFFAKVSNAQTLSCEEMEANLRKEYAKILYYQEKHNYDSIEIQNKIFLGMIKFYTQYFPETISYPFKSLSDSFGFNIVISEDSLFKTYSWGTLMGGTWRCFKTILQYKYKGEIFSQYNGDSASVDDGFYSFIYTLKTNDKTYYLGIQNGIYSTKDCGQFVQIYVIENGQVNDTVKLIKTKTGIRNRLGFEYDFFSVVGRPERPLKLITYDSSAQTINIPVVLENGKVTNKFIHYKFTGKYFEKVNVKKPK